MLGDEVEGEVDCVVDAFLEGRCLELSGAEEGETVLQGFLQLLSREGRRSIFLGCNGRSDALGEEDH